ncbi:MAG: 50S ribosomal protein L15 [Anaerolineae bacterium]|nr:50S ribosomal protein L15 [Anaerolineae bacterium]MDQ7036430.1 50S ribosomal protein L15 [Anaerolineae bacterium]
MKLHDLKPAKGSTKRRKRVGRGKAAGGGTYAGRGIKGQGARGRRKKRAYFEGGQLPLVRRLPFKRGFTNPFRIEYQEVNVGDLNDRFEDGATVNPEAMVSVGLLRDVDELVVVLGMGDVDKKLNISAHRISKSAAEKIEKAGGTFEKIELLVTGALATVKKLRKEEYEALRQQKQAK